MLRWCERWSADRPRTAMDMSRLLSSHGHRRAVGTWWRAHTRGASPPSSLARRGTATQLRALGSDGDHATDPPPRPVRSPRDGAGRRPGRRGGWCHGERRGRHGARRRGVRHRRPLLAARRQRRHRRVDVQDRQPLRAGVQAAQRHHDGQSCTATEDLAQLLARLPAEGVEGDRRRREGAASTRPTAGTSCGSPRRSRWRPAASTPSWWRTTTTRRGTPTPGSATGWPARPRSSP